MRLQGCNPAMLRLLATTVRHHASPGDLQRLLWLAGGLQQQPAPAAFATSVCRHCSQQQQLPQLPDGVVLLPMPALSHTMRSGRISKWLKKEGDACDMYDLLLELQTDSLVEEAYRLDSFAGTVTMLLETQEEVVVAKLLVEEGRDVAVGTPIALLADDPDKLQLAAEQAAAVASSVSNVYDESQQQLRTLVWQSYLKEAAKQSGSCMST